MHQLHIYLATSPNNRIFGLKQNHNVMLIFMLFSTLMSMQYCETPVDTINLQILYKQKVVGQFSAHMSKIGDLTVYQSNSTVTVNIVRAQISYQIKVVLRNGFLEESDLKMSVNGRLRTHSQTKRVGDVYTFYKNGKALQEVHEAITHTTIMLYFDEPSGISRTYSEECGDFCAILVGSPGTYQKINAKRKKNTYRYNDNLLKHLLIETTLMDFEMKTEMGDGQLAIQSISH
ncbi:MAG: hypothetical protein IPL46_19315 [Saprospiraceae bacterium]|nr:hypothetical protein [Saprospiraceae bacterium]